MFNEVENEYIGPAIGFQKKTFLLISNLIMGMCDTGLFCFNIAASSELLLLPLKELKTWIEAIHTWHNQSNGPNVMYVLSINILWHAIDETSLVTATN